MAYSKIKRNGQTLIKIETPEGGVFEFRSLSTKPPDPKLKAEGAVRIKAMREGFNKAKATARRRKVSLSKVLPVT